MSRKFVVLDLETLSPYSDAIILSAGAVFGEYGKAKSADDFRKNSFYVEVSIKSCKEEGLKHNADTVEWWKKQDIAAKQVLMSKEDDINIRDLVPMFEKWFDDNGIDKFDTDFYDRMFFDFTKLQYITEMILGKRAFWNYANQIELSSAFKFLGLDRYAGLKATDPVFKDLVYHNALDDAIIDAIRIQHSLKGVMF